MEMTESKLPNFSLIFNTINSQFVALDIVWLNTVALGQNNTFEKFVRLDSNLVIHLQVRIQDFPEEGALTYYLANFSQKLHENEEILGRGGARDARPP